MSSAASEKVQANYSGTIAYNGGAGLYAYDMGGGGDEPANLILFGNEQGFLRQSANISLRKCRTDDPRFVSDKDFRLRPDSPCIDAGRNEDWMIQAVDAAGRPRVFLADFEQGKAEGRYLPQSLPRLSFAVQEFDLALCSHFLFLHGEHLEFHFAAIGEMLRVAREVRLFPLVDVNGERSPYLEPVLDEFARFQPEICRVGYEFQRGGDKMLLLKHSSASSPD